MIRTIILGALLFAMVRGQYFAIPPNIQTYLQDMANMLLGTLNVIVSGCDPVNTNEIEYIYYNRQNPTKPIMLNPSNLKQVRSKLPTKMILHGWYGSATGPSAIELKDAYLKRGDYNIMFINWERHAMTNYAQAHCSLKIIGNTVGDFMYNLYKRAKIDLNKVHLIGHSLGAHLAGYVGQRVQLRTGGLKLFRITGLDAAGPGFFGFPEDSRLDASDAYFVDAIHTNGAQFGYPRNYGSVDFYPNCGLFQPGCMYYDAVDTATLLQQTMENLVCSHNRSVQYFIESINSRKFLATRFESCYLLFKCSRSFKKSRIVMGEDCPTNITGSYCLVTNSKPPYARGR